MDEINLILGRAVAALVRVPGVEAVVLGGSRATATHSPDSDIDIGVYYDAAALDLRALTRVAQALDDEHRANLIAAPGEWGGWVNGGGWLSVDGRPVDFILRDLARVATVIRECQDGVFSVNYHVGHPHAFVSAIYLGELAACRPLWDAGRVTALKATAAVYPAKLKSALIHSFDFEAGFSHMLAARYGVRNDTYYLMAQLVRAVSCLNQVLFALNERYCLNEKKSVRLVETFPLKPESYAARVEHLFAQAPANATGACSELERLLADVRSLMR